jgi:hypothetical protein
MSSKIAPLFAWAARLIFVVALVNMLLTVWLIAHGYNQGFSYPFPAWFNRKVSWSLNVVVGSTPLAIVGLFQRRSLLMSLLALIVNAFCFLLMAVLLTRG